MLKVNNFKMTHQKLVEILSNYKYNKYDNNYDDVCIYKIEQEEKLPQEEFFVYNNFSLSTYTFRKFAFSKEMRSLKIEVSNLGRVKINNKIAKQYQYKLGYLVVKITDNIVYDVYRLVAETWVQCPVDDTFNYEGKNCWTVHHITDNGFDNRPENLVWLNWNEHSKIHQDAGVFSYNNIIKKNLENDLCDSLITIKDTGYILDRLDDYYLLKRNDYDDLVIEKVCNKYGIDLKKYLNNRILKFS
jgi:hypothetical protein